MVRTVEVRHSKRGGSTQQVERHPRKTNENNEKMDAPVPISCRASPTLKVADSITSSIPNDGQRNIT